MVTDTYNRGMPDISAQSMLKNNDFSEDLSSLIRRQEAMSVREKELSMYRSGSAPPTVEGSLSAVGGLFDTGLWGFNDNGGKGLVTEEELRSDPGYVDYYYSNVNLNPRLPPPLLSKEDWRFTQRLHGGTGGGSGGIGDRRKGGGGGAGDGGGTGNRSLFSVQPGIAGKEDNEVETGKGTSEWGGDGLIGLSGLGLGSRQKSLAEIVQVTF